MWTPDQAYLGGLEFFGEIVDRVEPADWDRPSPCDGWSALDVLGHVGVTAQFGTEMLEGRQPAWTPGPSPRRAVEGDPGRWWHDVSAAIRGALSGADMTTVLDSPRGKRTVGEGMTFPAIDLFVHGWDLAVATGDPVELPHESIEFARQVMDALPEAQLRSPQVFAAPCAVREDASESDAFLAWTGRDPAWAPCRRRCVGA